MEKIAFYRKSRFIKVILRILCIICCVGVVHGSLAGFAFAGKGHYTVDDVEDQFGKITHHGDPLGFHTGVADDPDLFKHYQGVARYDGPDSTPYLFLTRLGKDVGELVVVRMGSRDKNGERLRSNKLMRGVKVEDTVPPMSDRGVYHIKFNGSGFWPNYKHPGGCQLIDDVLVVPLEKPGNTGAARIFSTETINTPPLQMPGDTGAMIFIDVKNPENPQPIKTFGFPMEVGVLGVTKDPVSQKYLFVFTNTDSTRLYFYQSTNTDIRSADFSLKSLDSWHKDEISGEKWEKWQCMNFVRQTDGGLYLCCMDNTGDLDLGEDWIRLFKVTQSGNAFSLEYRRERHLYLEEPQMGNCAAGGGVHVTPLGQLLVYVSEHSNSGPGGTVKMGEFRRYDLVPSCGGWVEFYEDEMGWNDESPDRSEIMDFVDRDKDDWNDLPEFGFDENIQSIRWNLPPGRKVICYKDPHFKGKTLELTGSGSYSELSGGWGDSISSVKFDGEPTVNEVLVGPPPLEPAILLALLPYTSPYNAFSVKDGLLQMSTCNGGVMKIQSGHYNEVLTITQPITIEAEGGVVTIGAP